MLVERHAPELVRLAAGIVGLADGDDLAQESLLAAWQQLSSLRDPNAFPAWVRRICVNRCRNALRARSRRVVAATLTSLDPAAAGDFRDPIHARAALDGAFEQLTVEQRALLTLHYGLGHSISETARTLGLPEGTCKSRLHAALVALRAAMPPEVLSA